MSPPPRRDPRARELLAAAGRGALLPFLDRPDKRWFAPRDAGGLVVYGRAGRVAVALGDPISKVESEAWAAFDRFIHSCTNRGVIPGVYQATPSAVTELRERRFRLVPVGREAIIDLATFDLAGSRRANLRHTVARAKRGGLRVAWHPAGLDDLRLESLLPGLVALDTAWRTTAGPPMGFTISQFGPGAVRPPAAVAIAVDPADRPVAFATFARTGSDGGWVLDLMRRLPDDTPGALEACVATRNARGGLAAAERALALGSATRLWEAETRRLRAEFLAELGASTADIEA